jgi:hypothetical protein
MKAGVGALAGLAVATLGTTTTGAQETEVPSEVGQPTPQSVHEVPVGQAPPVGIGPDGVDLSASSSPAPSRNGRGRANGDSMFPPRGFSVVPPNSGAYICFTRNSREGYWCRYLQGVDRLGDRRDFVVGFSSVYKKSEWNNTYGRALQSHGGFYYEGCRQRDSSSYRCDFRSQRQMNPMTTNQGAGYELRILREWLSWNRDHTGPCGMNIVGFWVGNNDLGGIISSCRGAGPYPGYRP